MKRGSSFSARGLLLLASLWLGAAARADEWISGRVVAVTDGDTAVVETARREALRVRFYGIDAPESANADWPAQAYAAESTRFMRELIDGKQVRVRLTGERTYKREVGEIFLREQSASAASVAAGLAWWNKKFARKDRRLEQLQATPAPRGGACGASAIRCRPGSIGRAIARGIGTSRFQTGFWQKDSACSAKYSKPPPRWPCS